MEGENISAVMNSKFVSDSFFVYKLALILQINILNIITGI